MYFSPKGKAKQEEGGEERDSQIKQEKKEERNRSVIVDAKLAVQGRKRRGRRESEVSRKGLS